ncbi:MAG TPA: hypothetical protein VGN26_04415 [Armatimonadota bacterium]|jgi:hypothetical protein
MIAVLALLRRDLRSASRSPLDLAYLVMGLVGWLLVARLVAGQASVRADALRGLSIGLIGQASLCTLYVLALQYRDYQSQASIALELAPLPRLLPTLARCLASAATVLASALTLGALALLTRLMPGGLEALPTLIPAALGLAWAAASVTALGIAALALVVAEPRRLAACLSGLALALGLGCGRLSTQPLPRWQALAAHFSPIYYVIDASERLLSPSGLGRAVVADLLVLGLVGLAGLLLLSRKE